MKSQWKPREKAVKNIEKPSKSGLCKTCKKNGFAILWPIFLISAPALYGCCWSYGAFFFQGNDFFEAFSHWGPLL